MATLQSTLKLTLLDQVSARAKHITGTLNGLQRQTAAMSAVSSRLLAYGATYLGVTQGLQHTAGAAISFETAFAGVKKVVEASDEQIQGIERSIRKLSTTIPTTANDLAGLYAAAAESGIATNELNAFAEMAARVGVAFDIPAAQAGESLAKLKTQLGLTLTETGDLADVMNHLSNSMASKAGDITNFMLRVGALAEMGGFAKEEIAALGSAMIAAGAEPETAATAMQNVVKALARGKFAKAGQKVAAKALGLDLPAIAKLMQKDAPKALKTVLGAIGKAPKEQQMALLSEFFGDEAKAFAPLVGNIKLLDDALSAVGDKTRYAGSAFREYVEQSKTTANVLQVLQNKFAELGRGIGSDWLPTIKGGALGLGHVIDTLGERATIFDQIGASMKGFMQGMGFKGDAESTMKALGDLLLGPADGSASADRLGGLFARFEGYGASIKQFATDVDEGITKFEKAFKLDPGAVSEFLGSLGGWGLTLGASAVGITAIAGAIGLLAKALFKLSGASLLLGGAKGLTKLLGAMSTSGSAINAAANGAKGTQIVKPGAVPWKIGGDIAEMGKWAKSFAILQTISGLWDANKNASPGGLKDNVNGARSFADSMTRWMFGDEIANQSFASKPVDGQVFRDSNGAGIRSIVQALAAIDRKLSATDGGVQARIAQQMAIQSSMFPGKTKDDLDVGRKTVSIDAASISALLQPSGTQDVRVTNKQPPNLTINQSVSISGVLDPKAAASTAMSEISSKVLVAMEAAHTDGIDM